VKLIVDMDLHELACRIAEATMEQRRPPGTNPQQAMAVFEPFDREGFYRAAEASIVYLSEQVAKGTIPS
jgi:hypothetical protein